MLRPAAAQQREWPQAECGAAFTNKLEGMFKDVDLSRDALAAFRNSVGAWVLPARRNCHCFERLLQQGLRIGLRGCSSSVCAMQPHQLHRQGVMPGSAHQQASGAVSSGSLLVRRRWPGSACPQASAWT